MVSKQQATFTKLGASSLQSYKQQVPGLQVLK